MLATFSWGTERRGRGRREGEGGRERGREGEGGRGRGRERGREGEGGRGRVCSLRGCLLPFLTYESRVRQLEGLGGV